MAAQANRLSAKNVTTLFQLHIASFLKRGLEANGAALQTCISSFIEKYDERSADELWTQSFISDVLNTVIQSHPDYVEARASVSPTHSENCHKRNGAYDRDCDIECNDGVSDEFVTEVCGRYVDEFVDWLKHGDIKNLVLDTECIRLLHDAIVTVVSD